MRTRNMFLCVLLLTTQACKLGADQLTQKTIPVVKEPEFVTWDETRSRPLSHLQSSVDAIVTMVGKFNALQLDKGQFSFLKSSLVKSGAKLYRRDVFIYRFANIKTEHGMPTQEITLWFDAPEGKSDGAIAAMYAHPSQWPL